MTLLTPKDIPEEETVDSILIDMFGKSPEVRLLDFFLDHPINDFMQSELAERTGMNKRTIRRVLEQMLEVKSIVITRTIGKAVLYRLNHESEIVKEIRKLENIISTSFALEQDEFLSS